MKKLLAFALAAMMLFGLAASGLAEGETVTLKVWGSQEVDTEYACGDYRSKYWVQTRYFLVNRPHFKQFFLLSV